MDKYKEIVTIKAVGRASAGFLGNPGNAVLILAGILGLMGGLVGLDGAKVITDFYAKLMNLHNATEGQDQRDAAFDFTNAQRALIEFFFPAFKFVPPLEPEPPAPPTGGGGGGGGSG